MTHHTCYLITIAALFPVAGGIAVRLRRLPVEQRRRQSFSLQELATLALLICLLYVAAMPWKIGLSHLPGLDALVFAIPYTTFLLLGIRLVPKLGTATLLIVGEGIFGQLVGSGLNPAWWPYYLWCALALELLFLFTNDYARSFLVLLGREFLAGFSRLCLPVSAPCPVALASILSSLVYSLQRQLWLTRCGHRRLGRLAAGSAHRACHATWGMTQCGTRTVSEQRIGFRDRAQFISPFASFPWAAACRHRHALCAARGGIYFPR